MAQYCKIKNKQIWIEKSLKKSAKKNGTKILVITCYDRSPLAKYADYILLSTRREAAYEGGSVSTIGSISYLINVLYHAIYERLGEKSDEYTMRAASAVANKSL